MKNLIDLSSINDRNKNELFSKLLSDIQTITYGSNYELSLVLNYLKICLSEDSRLHLLKAVQNAETKLLKELDQDTEYTRRIFNESLSVSDTIQINYSLDSLYDNAKQILELKTNEAKSIFSLSNPSIGDNLKPQFNTLQISQLANQIATHNRTGKLFSAKEQSIPN